MRCQARGCPVEALPPVPLVLDGFEYEIEIEEVALCGAHRNDLERVEGEITLSHAMRSSWSPDEEAEA